MKVPGSNMVDMKYSPDEQQEEAGEVISPTGSNLPDYPWGTCIDLDDVSLKKLSIDSLPDVGDEYHIVAMGKVTRLSSSADENESENRMTIQITMLQLVHEDEMPDEKETATSENSENKAGVKSLLTNAI